MSTPSMSTPSMLTGKKQKSILGFFQRGTPSTLPIVKKQFVQQNVAVQILTPAPSSDAVYTHEDDEDVKLPKRTGLPSPLTPASGSETETKALSSPSRNPRHVESDEEDALPRRRLVKRRRIRQDSEDSFGEDEPVDEDDFVVSDEDTVSARKRKRPSPPLLSESSSFELPTVSTAQQWTYDPEASQSEQLRMRTAPPPRAISRAKKQKAHTSEPENRYPWLANLMDADKHRPDDPEYDARSVYIPPLAWTNFSPFEKQYWEIKQNLWDTIVFFKKGKFYELYENDATIGHQLFDLKLTDRVNMRMVGVPESSLAHWANQFVAKGYKIARVDQMESALAKQMRDSGKTDLKPTKEDKVVRRELACILTAGTLVDGGMLQDDMATYCAAIKEGVVDGLPAFGIVFVDAATGHFSLTEFVDDQDLTRFETFVAQTRPQELLVEKSHISTKALRILKNNTSLTTVWNHLKPGKEFWEADIARREIEASAYFERPTILDDTKTLLWSALGALTWYLRSLKIDRDLLSLQSFEWYDPIRRSSSLVLDGQTLINLELFANSFDGGVDGTLFLLLNRCITPFGKRLFKQWVCHPLADAKKINARLDAVDALNADTMIRDQFTASLSRIPDLERLISRVHAGSCRGQDFLKVIEGFEQIEYTIKILGPAGNSLIGQLISAMPDLEDALAQWKTAFDRAKVRDHGILIPEPGVEEDFDNSQSNIDEIEAELQDYIQDVRKQLKCSSIVYKDNGKEIYQLELPNKISAVPKDWSQMSATKAVKRYYTPKLRTMIRRLEESRETHGQIAKAVAGRFFARFDEKYSTWLQAVKVIAHLDCLISLAKASSSLGEPSCRPTFIDDTRSVVEFEELRHPCMLPNSMDFIPNDISLGGSGANINMLTGANAAGKSTVLRMTCTAVIMAQIGCYVPCKSARLTPVDRIMSRLGAQDNIFAAQSTFFVELSETKKILSEATPRSLVILDELGRGTSSYDGVAVAQAVLHHVATHIGCVGFFATHYHSLAEEFAGHPEIINKRMRIHVDDENKKITFLYKLEDGVAEGSFGMHCAAMCGIPGKVIERAEVAAKEWEHTSRLKESLEMAKQGCYIPLGVQSDVAWILKAGEDIEMRGLEILRLAIAQL